MTLTNPKWARARSDLVLKTETGEEDVFLWEHTERVARNAQLIIRFPEVSVRKPDLEAVLAAALYHESAWAARVREGELTRLEILAKPMSSAHREQSALLLERSLFEFLPPDTLRRASEAVRALGERKVESIEGQILGEAASLEEFGLLPLWTMVRKGSLEGRGVQAAILTWIRRNEYQFWSARLKDSFRFARVRELAETRLQAFEQFMTNLVREARGEDLKAMVEQCIDSATSTRN